MTKMTVGSMAISIQPIDDQDIVASQQTAKLHASETEIALRGMPQDNSRSRQSSGSLLTDLDMKILESRRTAVEIDRKTVVLEPAPNAEQQGWIGRTSSTPVALQIQPGSEILVVNQDVSVKGRKRTLTRPEVLTRLETALNSVALLDETRFNELHQLLQTSCLEGAKLLEYAPLIRKFGVAISGCEELASNGGVRPNTVGKGVFTVLKRFRRDLAQPSLHPAPQKVDSVPMMSLASQAYRDARIATLTEVAAKELKASYDSVTAHMRELASALHCTFPERYSEASLSRRTT